MIGNGIFDPRHIELTEKMENAYSTSKQANTHEVSNTKKFFEPIGFAQSLPIVKRIQENVKEVFINLDYFRFNAFKAIKNERNWNMPEGTYAFNLVDLRHVFTADIKWNVPFSCYFLKTSKGMPYRAWLHKNEDGIVRYYIQNPLDEEERWMMDVVDLYGLAFGGNSVIDIEKKRYLRHRSFDLVRSEQSLLSNKVVVDEKDRLRTIKEQLLSRQQRNLVHHTDETLIAVMMELIEEANKRTFVESYFDSNGRSVFLMSTSELVRRLTENYSGNTQVKKTKVTINNAVNLLVGLGFIEKMNDKKLLKVDEELVWARNQHARGGKNPIMYYVIKDLPSFYWVNKQSKKLIKKNVTVHNVSERRMMRALGKEFTKEVFVGTYIEKKKHQYENEKEAYTRTFYLRLKQDGIVTKDSLENIIPNKTVSNRLWTDLVNETRGFYVKRTSKFIREKFDISSTGALFVSATEVHPFRPSESVRKSVELERFEKIEKEYEVMVETAIGWYGWNLKDRLEDMTNNWMQDTENKSSDFRAQSLMR